MAKRRCTLPAARLVLVCSLLTVSCPGAAVDDESWPRFRGPAGSGISTSTNLPVRWTDADFHWKTPLPGKGHSSPVVWKDRVFVTSGDPTNADRHILCLAAGDGRIQWQKTYASKNFQQHRENSFGTATPVLDDKGVYVYWTTPEAVTVAALSPDGRERWVKQLGPFKSTHGSGASPVVYGGLVWISNDQDGPSSLMALQTDSGEVKHRIERRADKTAYGTPCLLRRPGAPEELIFASSSHGLTSVNPVTGLVNWECTNLFNARIVGSPIANDGLVICASGEGGVGRKLVAVAPPNGSEPPKLIYEMKSGIPYVPTPLAKDGRLYLLCDNGQMRCVRTATGEPIWEERLPERFYSSVVGGDNKLYLTSKGGEVFVLAMGDRFELLARNSLGGPTFATPAIANGTLFFRTETHVMAIRTGK